MRDNQEKGKSLRGFASLPPETLREVSKRGGKSRAEQLGSLGYVELGRKGGKVRSIQLGHEGYIEMGRKGGRECSKRISREGYVLLGRKGGEMRAAKKLQQESTR